MINPLVKNNIEILKKIRLLNIEVNKLIYTNLQSDDAESGYMLSKKELENRRDLLNVDIKDIEQSINEENNNIEDNDMNKVLYPCLRKNHASLILGSYIFIYGGIDSNNNFLNDCWIYDLNKKKWDLLDFRGRYPPPLGFHSCCMALEKDQLNSPFLSIYNKPASNRKTLPLLKLEGIFFFGGINETKIPTNLFFQLTIGLKPASFEIPPTNGKPPSARICASMNFSPQCNMIFIHGGKNDFLDDVHLNDIVMLDLETLDWIHPATNNLIPLVNHPFSTTCLTLSSPSSDI